MPQRVALLSFALAINLGVASPVLAQEAPSVNPLAPTETPAPDIALPGLTPLQAPAATSPAPAVPAVNLIAVRLAALLTQGGTEIPSGVTWRVFSPEPGADGKLPLVASKDGGVGEFRLAPGSYLVHAAFGRAGATKRISVGKEPKREDVVLDAGGLKLNALLAGGKEIPSAKLRFSVYEDKPDAAGNRPLIIPDVKPNTIVRLNAGVYHVVSNYGSGKSVAGSVVRSDIRVEAGKLTEALVEHTAAQLTLKLVRDAGGEALAETAWSIVNDSGDPVVETVGPYATIVLSEGNYTAIAKNRERIYQKDVTVESGRDAEVEVIANSQSEIDPNEGAD